MINSERCLQAQLTLHLKNLMRDSCYTKLPVSLTLHVLVKRPNNSQNLQLGKNVKYEALYGLKSYWPQHKEIEAANFRSWCRYSTTLTTATGSRPFSLHFGPADTSAELRPCSSMVWRDWIVIVPTDAKMWQKCLLRGVFSEYGRWLPLQRVSLPASVEAARKEARQREDLCCVGGAGLTAVLRGRKRGRQDLHSHCELLLAAVSQQCDAL